MKASLDFVPQDGVEGFGGFVAVDLDKVVSFAGEFSEMRTRANYSRQAQ